MVEWKVWKRMARRDPQVSVRGVCHDRQVRPVSVTCGLLKKGKFGSEWRCVTRKCLVLLSYLAPGLEPGVRGKAEMPRLSWVGTWILASGLCRVVRRILPYPREGRIPHCD